MKGFDIDYRECVVKNTMVGERYKRELEDEAQKWRRRSKVWNILKRGEIMNYIKHLHEWKPFVTKSMVRNWNKGMVKIDGVEFFVTKEIIS